jgi:hypothetical protein
MQWVELGHSTYWQVEPKAIARAVDATVASIDKRYPGAEMPYHSRWRHFEANAVDRIQWLAPESIEPRQRARRDIDLALVSVLLDAGAGPDWAFHEHRTNQTIQRSEGLGVASFHAFMAGRFSSDPEHPWQVDARGLERLRLSDLAQVFQVSEDNPLVGLHGRLQLLHNLAHALHSQPQWFGTEKRPGRLLDALAPTGQRRVSAASVLEALLQALGPIWPAQNKIETTALGDCWPHPAGVQGWVAFHKLSQWLTYSLLEPLQRAGLEISDLDALTGLPEYRNGGLLIDTGVILPRSKEVLSTEWHVGDAAIVEWRALTVCLLDEIAKGVSQHYGKPMSLANVLEGGTWAAGRAAAAGRGGQPPLHIASDGTVF